MGHSQAKGDGGQVGEMKIGGDIRLVAPWWDKGLLGYKQWCSDFCWHCGQSSGLHYCDCPFAPRKREDSKRP